MHLLNPDRYFKWNIHHKLMPCCIIFGIIWILFTNAQTMNLQGSIKDMTFIKLTGYIITPFVEASTNIYEYVMVYKAMSRYLTCTCSPFLL
jgi:hypothetical protein